MAIAPEDGEYPYRVVMTVNVGIWSHTYKERELVARFLTKADVIAHLRLVKIHNKNWIKIKIYERGECIKQWQRNLNIGTLIQ